MRTSEKVELAKFAECLFQTGLPYPPLEAYLGGVTAQHGVEA